MSNYGLKARVDLLVSRGVRDPATIAARCLCTLQKVLELRPDLDGDPPRACARTPFAPPEDRDIDDTMAALEADDVDPEQVADSMTGGNGSGATWDDVRRLMAKWRETHPLAEPPQRSPKEAPKKRREDRRPRNNYWAEDEDALVRQHYERGARDEIEALLPGRTWKAICQRGAVLGLRRPRGFQPTWSAEAVRILRELWPTRASVSEVCERLPEPHSEEATRRKASDLGLKRRPRPKEKPRHAPKPTTRRPPPRDFGKPAPRAPRSRPDDDAKLIAEAVAAGKVTKCPPAYVAPVLGAEPVAPLPTADDNPDWRAIRKRGLAKAQRANKKSGPANGTAASRARLRAVQREPAA